jgi:hypothetical protein
MHAHVVHELAPSVGHVCMRTSHAGIPPTWTPCDQELRVLRVGHSRSRHCGKERRSVFTRSRPNCWTLRRRVGRPAGSRNTSRASRRNHRSAFARHRWTGWSRECTHCVSISFLHARSPAWGYLLVRRQPLVQSQLPFVPCWPVSLALPLLTKSVLRHRCRCCSWWDMLATAVDVALGCACHRCSCNS